MHPHIFNLLRSRALFAPDGGGEGGGGAGGGGQQQQQQQQNQEPQTFSLEYVRELRNENKGLRLANADLTKKTQEHEAKIAEIAKENEGKLTAAQQAANERIVRSELKAVALAAGMIDMDGLKLADLSKVTLKDDGSLEGAAEAIEALKKAKPYLFGTGNTGSTEDPPPRKDGTTSAKAMTKEEYAAAKKKLTSG